MDAAGNDLNSLANQRIAARGDEKRQKTQFLRRSIRILRKIFQYTKNYQDLSSR